MKTVCNETRSIGGINVRTYCLYFYLFTWFPQRFLPYRLIADQQFFVLEIKQSARADLAAMAKATWLSTALLIVAVAGQSFMQRREAGNWWGNMMKHTPGLQICGVFLSLSSFGKVTPDIPKEDARGGVMGVVDAMGTTRAGSWSSLHLG